MKKLVIASDHAGIALKEFLQKEITDYSWNDLGPFSKDSVDYPDYAEKACAEVLAGRAERAVLICGTGLGMSIAANKITGIRAAHAESEFTARMSAAHNNANVLCLGERVTGVAHALSMVRAWLDTPFEARHQKRIDKIHSLEK